MGRLPNVTAADYCARARELLGQHSAHPHPG